MKVRQSNQRGFSQLDWLKSYHSFSFDQYYDPEWTHFRSLRVMNEDWIDPGKGFPDHPHRDMEIFTYVLSGSLEHKDSMGNGSVIKPGWVQKMTAGKGVIHSEFNPSSTEATHLYQIWVLPNEKNLTPSYDQVEFSKDAKQDRLCLILSESGQSGSISIHQDLNVYASILSGGKSLQYQGEGKRYTWVQLLSGSLYVDQQILQPGDGVAFENNNPLILKADQESEFLVFDLA